MENEAYEQKSYFVAKRYMLARCYSCWISGPLKDYFREKEIVFDIHRLLFRESTIDDNKTIKVAKRGTMNVNFPSQDYIGTYEIEQDGEVFYLTKVD